MPSKRHSLDRLLRYLLPTNDMVSAIPSATGYAAGPALLSAAVTASSSMCGTKRPFSATLHDASSNSSNADPTQKRSPLLCGYPSKKCWAWRVEKRNGELHKFCEYHRQKANTNQRRMEQRRKNGRAAQKSDASTDASASTNNDASTVVKEEGVTATATTTALKIELENTTSKTTTPHTSSSQAKSSPTINTAMANAESTKRHRVMSASAAASTPRGVDDFDSLSPPLFSWAEVDLDIGMDAAVEYMMIDHAIDSEPSDKPVDLYEEDLYFLEHFIAEIATSVM